MAKRRHGCAVLMCNSWRVFSYVSVEDRVPSNHKGYSTNGDMNHESICFLLGIRYFAVLPAG